MEAVVQVLAMMNVVTGVFVESALGSAREAGCGMLTTIFRFWGFITGI